MDYSINKKLPGKSFDEAISLVTELLKNEGFGIITEIDITSTLKEKISVDFRKYKILGACNPHFAYESIKVEDKIGVFLPCNVVVQEHESGEVEVSAMDPIVAMSPVENPLMVDFAKEIREKLYNVIENL
jgi:uncharacterized protein (DUF302 family)